MKEQTMKDRRDERRGMDMGLGRRMAGEGRFRETDHVYENEVEKPSLPREGMAMEGLGMHDFKGEADPIAYGQASEEGCRADMKRMSAQFKDYHWD